MIESLIIICIFIVFLNIGGFMINFDFKNPSRIVFGDESIKKLDSLLKEYGAHTVLLIGGSGGSARRLGICDEVENACKKIGAKYIESLKVVANPKVELVRELIQIGKENNVDFILAVGGGSPIDTAKSVALGIPYEGDVWDFYDGKATPKSAISLGAITTIPASGSETSNAAILSNGLYKKGVEDDLILPKFAIMNPTYTLGLPPFQTSAGCADILSHLLERYFTTTENVDVTDYLLEGAIKACMLNALRLVKDPSNYNARAEMQLLASLAHNGMLDLGRATDWASHRIEHELSGQYNITHGAGMAVVLVAYTKYMADKLPKKMAQLANRVFNVDYHDYTEKEMALILSDKLKEFFEKINLKTTLTEYEIDREHFKDMAMRATNDDKNTVGHYIPLHAKEFMEILELAL